MDKRTLTALQESIEKWELIVSGEMPDLGSENCALCVEFAAADGAEADADCVHCPVAAASGQSGCIETPWERWNSLQGNSARFTFSPRNFERVADTPVLLEAARAELKFLRSLLP